MEYAHLKALGNRTADHALKGKIAEYLERMEQGFQDFRENSDRRCVYVLRAGGDGSSRDGERPACGYFSDWETALGYGKKEKEPFEIEKYLVDGVDGAEDGTCVHNPVAEIRFDRSGEAVCFWNRGWKAGFNNRRFEDAIIEVPNPFERGDIVKCRRTDGQEIIGIVEEGQEEWKQGLAWRLDRVKGGDPCVDFQDLFISVAFLCDDGTPAFSDSTTPLDLERYQSREEGWADGSADVLLLCARDIYRGRGCLSTFFDMLERYRQSGRKEMD